MDRLASEAYLSSYVLHLHPTYSLGIAMEQGRIHTKTVEWVSLYLIYMGEHDNKMWARSIIISHISRPHFDQLYIVRI